MHVQKLAYLSHGWNLAVNGKPLIEDSFEAWEFGPVVRKLYDALRRFGTKPIAKEIRWGDDTPFPSDDGDVAIADLLPQEIRLIDEIWKKYRGFEAFQLSALTHERGSPWQMVFEPRKNKIIPSNLIWDYFADQANAA
jgi:uncharacterized phage-associated protein